MPDTTRWPLQPGYEPEQAAHTLHPGDAADLLTAIPDESVRLVLTSPPYNIGKAYEQKATLADYLAGQEPLIDELVRVLQPGGSLCWQVGNHVAGGEVVPLDIVFYDLFRDRGMRLRNRIVWTFGHGLHAKRRFSGRYETILWFTKGDDPYLFNLDPVRVPSKYPGKRHFKGPKAGQLSGNPLGKNPSDIWTVLTHDWENEVWDIPNVKNNHPEKTTHPCQYPIELAARCVLALTEPGETVLDPYAGAGSSLLAAAMHGRRGVGAEWTPEYAQIITDRFTALAAGTLKHRKLGRPVAAPTGQAAERPVEWDGQVNNGRSGS